MPVMARPIRCNSREAPFGRADIDDEIDIAPIDAEIERDVHTTARRRPLAIAASTLRRCATSSEP